MLYSKSKPEGDERRLTLALRPGALACSPPLLARFISIGNAARPSGPYLAAAAAAEALQARAPRAPSLLSLPLSHPPPTPLSGQAAR